MAKVIPVRVCLRIRPLVPREVREGAQDCLELIPNNPQVVLRGTEKAFTYDYVFGTSSTQNEVYNSAVAQTVKQLFNGYNVTVIAYGQTGSGKTHSMGTSYDEGIDPDDHGIIPRAVSDIFTEVATNTEKEFLVKVSFVELYKEVLYDLLNTNSREECILDIRDDAKGGIKFHGLTEIPVTSLEETMKCLERGSGNRATGATQMNSRSSRSHAIFSLHIEMLNKDDKNSLVCSKFHLVDLAGSERAKKTGATGNRFKEGVNINKGLLALGNVISALCEEGNKGFIPYRNSKLTRLLQDSLGGNSHTVMLACVSPADSNFDETLSTLRYADRARSIKNKPIVNRDPQAAELAKLKSQVQQLQVQLISANASGGQGNVSYEEKKRLLDEINCLRDENEKLTRALQTSLEENTCMVEKALMAEMSKEKLKQRLEELIAQTGSTVENLNKTFDVVSNPQYEEQLNLVKDLQKKVIDLQSEQQRSDRAIIDHELSRHNVSTAVSFAVQSNDNTMEYSTEEKSIPSTPNGEFGAAYTLRKAKLNEELQELNKALLLKEELMNKMSTNDNTMFAVKNDYEKNVKHLEEQIDELVKERDQLCQKLRNNSSANASKVAEQRRKRLQELEGHIADYKRKIKEQSKLLKMKEQSELKAKKLTGEIVSMKAIRVKLLKQMKEDSEKFRIWKSQKDKEVAKLKEQDRRKQYQIVKMENLHTKQQNVLKRKMEEAVAINKRLKDAMALQKSCNLKKNLSKDNENVAARIKSWMEGELEIVVVKKEAQQSLKSLIEDRKTISDQITQTKVQLLDGGSSEQMKTQLSRKQKDLEHELELRSAQINDLQMKIVDEEDEIKAKKRFDSLQSMGEAKIALKHLFDALTNSQVDMSSKNSEIKELQMQYDEIALSLEECESMIKSLKNDHLFEIEKISREHEDKVLYMLSEMNKKLEGNSANENLDELVKQKMKFQESEIERLSKLHEELMEKSEECQKLSKEIQELKTKESRLPAINIVPPPRAKSKVVKKITTTAQDHYESSSGEESLGEDDEDIEFHRDPDWIKTPLAKKLQFIKSRNRMSGDDEQKKRGKKRSSSESNKCGCKKGGCKNKMCLCVSNSFSCGLNCSCDLRLCANRKDDDSTKENSTLNCTFEIGSHGFSENAPKKQRVTSSLSFSEDDDESPPPPGSQSFKLRRKLMQLDNSSPDMFA